MYLLLKLSWLSGRSNLCAGPGNPVKSAFSSECQTHTLTYTHTNTNTQSGEGEKTYVMLHMSRFADSDLKQYLSCWSVFLFSLSGASKVLPSFICIRSCSCHTQQGDNAENRRANSRLPVWCLNDSLKLSPPQRKAKRLTGTHTAWLLLKLQKLNFRSSVQKNCAAR